MDAPELAALPPNTRAALLHFAESLAGKLGEGLITLALFGGAAKGQYDPARSDLNVVAVLREVTPGALDHLAVAANVARRDASLELMVLAESDLPDCVEVFATKFHDLQRHHVLLHGRDVLAPLVISRERLVRQARRELMNLKLRLRQAYLERRTRPEALAALLHRGRKTMQVNLAALLEDAALECSPSLRAACEGLERTEDAVSVEAGYVALGGRLEAVLQALGPA